MKKISLTLLFISVVMLGYGQEEFHRKEGGMTLSYGHAGANNESSNSVGFGFGLKKGLTFGVSSQQILDETKPQFYIGYLSKRRDKNNYMRPIVQFSYMGSSAVRIMALNTGLSHIINARKNFPTSFNGVWSLSHVKYKKQENYYSKRFDDIIPVVGLMINQAFFSNHTITPVVGIGLGHNLKDDITSFAASFGLNINFGGAFSKS